MLTAPPLTLQIAVLRRPSSVMLLQAANCFGFDMVQQLYEAIAGKGSLTECAELASLAHDFNNLRSSSQVVVGQSGGAVSLSLGARTMHIYPLMDSEHDEDPSMRDILREAQGDYIHSCLSAMVKGDEEKVCSHTH
jgi:hypothetical protein